MERIEEKLARVAFHRGPESHVTLDQEFCATCRIGRVCAKACPAQAFTWDEKSGAMAHSWENCMECGTCRIVCTEGAITWKWPRGGFGVCYLQG